MVSFKDKVSDVVNIQRVTRALGFDDTFRDWGKYEYLESLDNLQMQLSRKQLKKHLEARNELTSGTKRQLCERLLISIKTETERRIRESKEAEAEHERILTLEQSGSVYVAGRNDLGQLGLTSEEASSLIDSDFIVVPKLRGIKPCSLSCGGNTVFCVTEDCLVYSWGVSDKTFGSFDVPCIIERLVGEEIKHVSAGSSHACASSLGGDCFVWGHLCVEKYVDQPVLVDDLPVHEEVVCVSSGEKHNCVLTKKGTAYSWGYATDGRLGINCDLLCKENQCDISAFISSPTLVTFPYSREKLRSISCGALHTLAISCTNQIYSWGSGSGGRLGHGDFEDRMTPTPINSLAGIHCSDISAGTWHSACIVIVPPLQGSGWLMTWGTGCYGQLALGRTPAASKPTLVTSLRRRKITLRRIFCGSHHCAAISSKGALYTWGSNSYSCLGRDVSINATEKDYSSYPEICPGFGKIINRIGRGLPLTLCCGRGFTIVGTKPFKCDA